MDKSGRDLNLWISFFGDFNVFRSVWFKFSLQIFPSYSCKVFILTFKTISNPSFLLEFFIIEGRIHAKDVGDRREKPPTHTYFLAVLDPYLQIFDFSTILPQLFAIVWWSFAFLSQFLAIFLWLLIVLTILDSFVRISDKFCINSCVQNEEYTYIHTILHLFLWKNTHLYIHF